MLVRGEPILSLPRSPPETEDEIDEMTVSVSLLVPKYPGVQYALLYATQSSIRRTVRVPVSYGVDKIESTDDILTELYIPTTAPPNLRYTSRGRFRIEAFGGVPLPYAYTIFYAPQSDLPPNTNVNECPPVKRAGITWYGNILVVRHGLRKAVINVAEKDALLVDVIITRYSIQWY
ncbi:hypothetical protein R3P38DRAFT_2589377 [Favolaschia claudopus]|uniref:Uncharacterized protein n=1 Tax=Favolaschia claudopus TaxID=2862362 RepID=A0AAV9Z1M0_9AGAR